MSRAAVVMLAGVAALVLGACGSPQPKKIELVAAPAGTVETIVKTELQRARRDGRRALVYIGATWCEPCRRFHDAVQAGRLDRQFGELRLVEFDLDRDGDRLREAGYAPRLIPMLALPDAEGRASGRQTEGSIKGDGAVADLVPRLSALLRH